MVSDYMQDLSAGLYALPEHTELALRNIFTMSAMKITSLRLFQVWLIPSWNGNTKHPFG